MRPNPPPRPQETFRPPLISMIYAVVLALATIWLIEQGKAGQSVASFAALGTGGMAVMNVNKAIVDQSRKRAYRTRVKDHHAKAKDQGKSEWATSESIQANANFNQSGGLMLGMSADRRGRLRDCCLVTRRNVLVNAPAGCGKTTGLILPGMLSLSSSPTSAESFFAFDPAAECLSVMYPWLERHGYEIFALTPFIEEVREISGRSELQDAGIDVFCSVRLGMPERKIQEQLRSIAKRIIPDAPRMTQEEKFFFNMARKFVSYFAWRELSAGVNPSLPNIAREFLKGPQYLRKTFAEDEHNDAFDGLVADMAASYGGVLMSAGEQFAGGYEIGEHHLQHFFRGALSDHVSRCTLDARRLINPHEKIAIFCVYPLEHLQSHAVQASMTITHVADTLAAAHRPGKCTFFIDEAGAIPLLSLAQNLNLYRKMGGQRYVLVFQDVMGQTEANYGRAMKQQIIAGTQIKLAMSGIVEYETLKMFSDLCGTRGITSLSLSDRANMADRMPDLSPGMGHVSVPLARPEDIRLLGPGRMLMIAEHLHPAILNTVPYWTREVWNEGTAPNPWYMGD